MWILSFVPDALLQLAVLAVLGAGVGVYAFSFFLNFYPPALPYREPIRILGTLLAICGVYFYGGYSTELEWRTKVDEAQAKVAKAEEASKEFNTKLDQERKKKAKVRTEYITTVKERIVEKQVQIDAKCELDPAVTQILNDAAKNTVKKGSVTIEEVKK
jgi:hypothetical protein